MKRWPVIYFKRIFTGLFLLLLSLSCTSKIPKTTTPVADLSAWFDPQKKTYIQSGCTLFNLRLEPIGNMPGHYCILKSNGSTLFGLTDHLYHYDNNKYLIWEIKDFYVHHQLNLSETSDNILTINSIYKKDLKYNWLRYDELVVLNSKGKKIKTFSFYDYLTKNKIQTQLRENSWSTDGFQNKSHEHTHINSFREIYSTVSGKKILTGYFSYCANQQKIFYFDKELKKIKRMIGMPTRLIHDVKQLTENTLIYFLNHDSADLEPRHSRIETFNLITNEFKILYQNNNIIDTFPYNSSVQILGDDRYFIFYHVSSSAKGREKKTTSYMELIDLKNKKMQLFPLEKWLYGANALVIDNLDLSKFNQ